jgi:hypothetical protein
MDSRDARLTDAKKGNKGYSARKMIKSDEFNLQER